MNLNTNYPDDLYQTDSATFGGYRIEDELFSSEMEDALFRMFDELDGLVVDHLPTSLLIEPVKLIQLEFSQKHGLFLTRQEVIDAYLRYEGGVCHE